ncbi:MAG: hypothetical protein JNG90_06790, partial [Planctomycetaceae bacterium]|nr:hypothetical protein [Planctomycetaceae bacterium]
MTATAERATSAQIAAEYQARFERYLREHRLLENRANRLSNWRAISFAGILAGLITGLAIPDLLLAGFAAAAVLLIVFIVQVRLHGRILSRLSRAARLVEVNREALARHRRDWEHLPKPRLAPDARHQSLAKDLDLFGRASLCQIMAPTHTPAGSADLKRWLVEPAAPAEIIARQQAVAELAPQLDWRQDLDLAGRQLGADSMHPERFVAWATGPRWLAGREWLLALAWLGPLAVLLLALAQGVGFVAGAWWMVVVVVQIVVSFFVCGRIHAIYNRISTRQGEIQAYSELFALAARMPHAAPELA